jgi:hypothetical protein
MNFHLFTRLVISFRLSVFGKNRKLTTDDRQLVRNHAFHLFGVRLVHNGVLIQLAFPLAVLGREDMARERVTAFHFAGTRFLEALRCARVRL